MSIFFQRTILFLFFVILQRSFFDVIWTASATPVVIIALIISVVFLEGFERGGLSALLALTLYLLLGQSHQIFILFAVLVAYGTSFLTRRLVIERPVQTSFILALVSAGFTVSFNLLMMYLNQEAFVWYRFFWSVVQAIGAFPLVFFIIKAWEGYVRESIMSEFRGMRT